MTLVAPDVARLFAVGSAYDCGRGMTAEVTRLPEALLPLPTGRVAAGDPFWCLDAETPPFTGEAPPGAYPVVVSVVRVARGDDPAFAHERVAAAWLRVSDAPARSWELAVTSEQDVSKLKPGEFFGYGVDAGTGCFVDASAVARLGAYLGEEGEPLEEALYRDESAGCDPVVVRDPDSGLSFVAFASGWGDGAYPTWVGRDAAGEVTGWVTEFFVVPQPGREDAED